MTSKCFLNTNVIRIWKCHQGIVVFTEQPIKNTKHKATFLSIQISHPNFFPTLTYQKKTDHNKMCTSMIEAGAVQTQLKEDINTRCLSNKLNSKKHKTSNHANLWTSWSLSVNQAALPTCKHPVAIWCSCSKEFVTDFIGHKTVWLIWIRHKKTTAKLILVVFFQHNSLFQWSIIITAKWCRHSNASSFKAITKIEFLSLHRTTQVFYMGQPVDTSLTMVKDQEQSQSFPSTPKQKNYVWPTNWSQSHHQGRGEALVCKRRNYPVLKVIY